MTAFEKQALRTLPRLRRYAASLCRDPGEAEDLVQDCLERAFARRSSWRGDNLAAWLMTILTNLYRNRVRDRASRPHHASLDDETETARTTLAAPTAEPDPISRRRLLIALETLQADQRAVLMLVVVEGYSYAEVAEILSVPVGTVMSRLSRARAALKTTLEGENVFELRRHR
ncbi:MAG: sigma-70 family RNA polymerase sigma factor [Rhodobiaceae bacterium]|nr:sigma-70 family RNA polymerase sigma factor [Rhodobiaceae bacterium]